MTPSVAWWEAPYEGQPRRSKRRPVGGWTAYAEGLLNYLDLKHAKGISGGDGTAGDADGGAVRDNTEWHFSGLSVAELLEKLGETELGYLAECGRDWLGNRQKGMRPCGCADMTRCPLCASTRAASLANVAVALYDDIMLALDGRYLSGSFDCSLLAHEFTIPDWMSALIEGLPGDVRRKFDNQLFARSWRVLNKFYGDGGKDVKLAGDSVLHVYGESDPGKSHRHIHNGLIPARRVESRDAAELPDGTTIEAIDAPPVVTWEPMPAWVEPDKLACEGAREGDTDERCRSCFNCYWFKEVTALARMLAKSIKSEGVKALARKLANGFKGAEVSDGVAQYAEDVDLPEIAKVNLHRSYKATPEEAKAYLAYQRRPLLLDLWAGIRSGGRYVYETAEGGKREKGERQLTVEEFASCIDRCTALGERFPRMRWGGYLSTPKVRQTFEKDLNCEKVPDMKDDEKLEKERWRSGPKVKRGIIMARLENIGPDEYPEWRETGQRELFVWDQLSTMARGWDKRITVQRRASWRPKENSPPHPRGSPRRRRRRRRVRTAAGEAA